MTKKKPVAKKKPVKKPVKKAVRKPRSVPFYLTVPLNKEMTGYHVYFRRPEVNELDQVYGSLSLKDNRRGYIYEARFSIERWGVVKLIGITAGCRYWPGFSDALLHYKHHAGHLSLQYRKEAIARLTYLRAKLNALRETLAPYGNAKPAVTFVKPEML